MGLDCCTKLGATFASVKPDKTDRQQAAPLAGTFSLPPPHTSISEKLLPGFEALNVLDRKNESMLYSCPDRPVVYNRAGGGHSAWYRGVCARPQPAAKMPLRWQRPRPSPCGLARGSKHRTLATALGAHRPSATSRRSAPRASGRRGRVSPGLGRRAGSSPDGETPRSSPGGLAPPEVGAQRGPRGSRANLAGSPVGGAAAVCAPEVAPRDPGYVPFPLRSSLVSTAAFVITVKRTLTFSTACPAMGGGGAGNRAPGAHGPRRRAWRRLPRRA